MTNRRQFIQTGLAVSAASFTYAQALRAESGEAAAIEHPIELFIYDDRFAQSVDAAETAQARNIAIASTTSVFTGLWYDQLDLRWRQTPMTLAGMTTEHSLFVFETLALDRGMNVIERGAGRDDELISWVIGPRNQKKSA